MFAILLMFHVILLEFQRAFLDFLIVVLNFTPTVHHEYTIGAPVAGEYEILMNSDSEFYGGSNVGDATLYANWGEWQNQPANLKITIPPLAGVILKPKK